MSWARRQRGTKPRRVKVKQRRVTEETRRTRETDLSSATGGCDRLDGNDVPKTDNLDVLRESVVRLGAKRVKRQSSDKAQTRVLDVKRATVGESKAQGDERFPIKFLG